MAGVGISQFDCPICFNSFTTPKLLPCYHLVCQSCVLSWIQRTGGRGQCPVCRVPILSEPRTGSQLQTEINKLPTDLATQALAESHSILAGPHQCGICTNNVAAQDFCLQCSLKLCSTCRNVHRKLPATSKHTVQQLGTLTVKQLTARHQVKCESHTQELAQLYCTSHSKLICFRCGATTHHTCPELREVEGVAKEERRKLQDRLERLEVKERNLAQQVDDVTGHFRAMRKTALDTFDDLSQRVDKQRCDILNLIQSEEDAMKASLKKMENARVSTALPIRNISNLVLESPDDGLLEISQNLVSRLDKLESQMKVKLDTRDVGRLVFDDQTLTRLQSDLAQLGQIQQPTSGPTAGATATTSATALGQIQQPTSGPTAGATATTSATASGQTQSPFRPRPAAGATAMTITTASGQIQLLTSRPAAGATAMTSATASGQRQSQVRPVTAPGATAMTSATASGHTQQSQQQGGRTSAAEASPMSALSRFVGLYSGQRQSRFGPTTAAGPTATTSATASGQIQQPISGPAAGATATTSATASGQRQSQVRPGTSAGATAMTSATASGHTQQSQQQGGRTSAAEPSPISALSRFAGLYSGQRQSWFGPTTAAGPTAPTSATASGQIQQLTSRPAAGATATTSATASGQRQSQVRPGTSAGATAMTSATASGHPRQSQQQGGRTSAAEATLTSAFRRFMGLHSGQRRSRFGPTTAAGPTATTSATASGPTTGAKRKGPALARVLKVGDRVKLTRGATDWVMHPGDTGTVTAIPSLRRAARGRDPQGWVDVRWDSAGEDYHAMGWGNEYHLILP